MNNNRQPMNNNNRRRGRNNNTNRPQNNNNRSGFDYLNQIDNKARGNASQMLEKYKKLASDAQLNGDRVTAESYLQFADHYFRVLADFRSRQETRSGENQNRQRDENRDDSGEGGFEEQDQVEAGEGDSSEQEMEREARPERQPRRNDRAPSDRAPSDRAPSDRNQRSERGETTERPVRDKTRTPRRHHSEEPADDAVNEGGLDIAVLPPSIAMTADLDEPVEFEAKPARKPRARRPKPSNDEVVVTAAE